MRRRALHIRHVAQEEKCHEVTLGRLLFKFRHEFIVYRTLRRPQHSPCSSIKRTAHSVDRIRGPGGARRLTDARAPDHRRSGATTKPFSSRAVSARCIYKLGSLQSSSLFIPRSHRRQSSDRPRCGSVCWCRPAAGNSRANPLAEATSSWAHGGGRRRTSP